MFLRRKRSNMLCMFVESARFIEFGTICQRQNILLTRICVTAPQLFFAGQYFSSFTIIFFAMIVQILCKNAPFQTKLSYMPRFARVSIFV